MDAKVQLLELREELKQFAEADFRKGVFKFFKEQINPIGVRLPNVRRIAKEWDAKNGGIIKYPELLELVNQLQHSPYFEENILGGYLLERHHRQFRKADFGLFEKWISNCVSNWAHCDLLCTGSFADFLERYPEFASKLENWPPSKNRWIRRASAVAFIPLAKKGLFHKIVFQNAHALAYDEDDLVQKGVGWTLRETAKSDQTSVFKFLMKHKDAKRTMLRYATERFSSKLKENVLH